MKILLIIAQTDYNLLTSTEEDNLKELIGSYFPTNLEVKIDCFKHNAVNIALELEKTSRFIFVYSMNDLSSLKDIQCLIQNARLQNSFMAFIGIMNPDIKDESNAIRAVNEQDLQECLKDLGREPVEVPCITAIKSENDIQYLALQEISRTWLQAKPRERVSISRTIVAPSLPAAIIETSPVELNKLLTNSFTNDKILEKKPSPIGELLRGEFQVFSWTATTVVINESGNAYCPDKIIKESNFFDSEKNTYYDEKQQKAVESAITCLVPSIETVLNRSLRNMRHKMVLGVQVIYANSYSASGSWHQDGIQNNYPLTSIVYFNHVNIHSKLSLKRESDRDDTSVLYSFETSTPCMITFNNQSLIHRVHDVYAKNPLQPAYRHLFTIFYHGPHFEIYAFPSSLKEARNSTRLSIQDKRKTQNNESPLPSESQSLLDNKFQSLYEKIAALKQYGEELRQISYRKKAGDNVIFWSDELHKKIDYFKENCRGNENKQLALNISKEINQLLIQSNKSMGSDRRWRDIIAHFILCCLGVGLIIMPLNKICTGSFFLNSTKRQIKLNVIKAEWNDINRTIAGMSV